MLSGMTLGEVALLAAIMLGLDWLLGGAWRRHAARPFVALAAWLERLLNRRTHRGAEVPFTSYWRGVQAWILAVLPAVSVAILLVKIDGLGLLIQGALLFACLGVRGGRASAEEIPAQHEKAAPLHPEGEGNPEESGEGPAPAPAPAREETFLGNRDRVILSTLFWFIVAGGPAALLYRLALVLADIWDARSRRFRYFGTWAARVRFALDWPAARLIAWSYALLNHLRRQRWPAWRFHASWFGGAGDACDHTAEGPASTAHRMWPPVASVSLVWIAGLMLASVLSWVLR